MSVTIIPIYAYSIQCVILNQPIHSQHEYNYMHTYVHTGICIHTPAPLSDTYIYIKLKG